MIILQNRKKKLTKEHKDKCSEKLKGINNPFYGRKHSEETLKLLEKKINQYSLDGTFIKTWKSIAFAEKILNIHSISMCTNKKLLSAGGYIWRFYNEKCDNIIINKKYRKPTYQYDLNNNFIKKWNSIREAETKLNIKHISKACNNYKSHRTSGGFIWKFD